LLLSFLLLRPDAFRQQATAVLAEPVQKPSSVARRCSRIYLCSSRRFSCRTWNVCCVLLLYLCTRSIICNCAHAWLF